MDKKTKKKLKNDIAEKYNGKIVDKDTPFAITEAFKMVRTNLVYSANSEVCPVFAITSAFASAGKSVIISNTALSFAQLDKKVLLIDGDMRKSTVHKILNIKNEGGLSEIILGVDKDLKYSDYFKDTDNVNLKVITSGHVPLNPSELLASVQFDKFIDAMRKEFDYIFIDLPPICVVSDAGTIAKHVTGYIIVVRSEQTEFKDLDNAIDSLKRTNANILGFVLNDINPKTNEYKKNYSKYSSY
jgi:capsular exopolysaccharide synthesis family protein